jgi:hypothetical protein
MSESDWKLFRKLRELALERFCERVLAEIGNLSSDSGQSYHERYLAVFNLVRERDKELEASFDEPRRSTALQQLALIRSYALLDDEEFSRFRLETRESVSVILGDR